MAVDPSSLLAGHPDSISVRREMESLELSFPDRLPDLSTALTLATIIVLVIVGMACASGTLLGLLLIPVIMLAGVWWRRQGAGPRDVLRLTPHTFQVDDHPPILLEDIMRIEVCPPSGSRWLRLHTRDGVFDVIGGLLDDEADWMGQLLAQRVRHRWQQLKSEGHDLSVRGTAPEQLLVLR